MSFFNNRLLDGRPICPRCKKFCKGDMGATSGGYITASGAVYIMHHTCAAEQNKEVKKNDNKT